MSTPAKARVAALICATFILWPGLHRVLVANYNTNAWQLGGFAMYATPPARTRVSIFENPDGQRNLLPVEFPDSLVEQRRLYLIRRGVLGSLLPPDELADAFFRARIDVDSIEVVVTREMLSASSARIERRESVYAYAR